MKCCGRKCRQTRACSTSTGAWKCPWPWFCSATSATVCPPTSPCFGSNAPRAKFAGARATACVAGGAGAPWADDVAQVSGHYHECRHERNAPRGPGQDDGGIVQEPVGERSFGLFEGPGHGVDGRLSHQDVSLDRVALPRRDDASRAGGGSGVAARPLAALLPGPGRGVKVPLQVGRHVPAGEVLAESPDLRIDIPVVKDRGGGPTGNECGTCCRGGVRSEVLQRKWERLPD